MYARKVLEQRLADAAVKPLEANTTTTIKEDTNRQASPVRPRVSMMERIRRGLRGAWRPSTRRRRTVSAVNEFFGF